MGSGIDAELSGSEICLGLECSKGVCADPGHLVAVVLGELFLKRSLVLLALSILWIWIWIELSLEVVAAWLYEVLLEDLLSPLWGWKTAGKPCPCLS